MICSMTGYGKAEIKVANLNISVELRSLNSKQMDLSLRMPPMFRSSELDLRSLLSRRLERGKVDCVVSLSSDGISVGELPAINKSAFAFYATELHEIAAQRGESLTTDTLYSIVMRIPEVVRVQESAAASEEQTKALFEATEQAIEHFQSFRAQEGKALELMFTEKLDGIAALLAEVEQYERQRIVDIRQRIENSLLQLSEQTQNAIDKNRFEQEMIYYIEKLDITEEKVRLSNHISYFRRTMEQEGCGVGKKLGFIAQEMGREINTLGSKSNQSDMQIIVVKMKDLLEQIKEQVLNVL